MPKTNPISDNNLIFAQAIKQLRTSRGISQFKLAVEMGWQGVAPIIQIEGGKRTPRPETICRFVEHLGGTYAEECLLLGLAGYLSPSRVPSLSQIKREMNRLADWFQGLPYPVYVVDYWSHIWLANLGTIALAGSYEAALKTAKAGISYLQLLFDSRFGLHPLLRAAYGAEIVPFLAEQIRRFKALNVQRQHEPFYRAYLDTMALRLPPEDFRLFKSLWEKTTPDNQHALPLEMGQFRVQLPDGAPLTFTRYAERLFRLGDFCEALIFIPDAPTAMALQARFADYLHPQAPCLKTWELTDPLALLPGSAGEDEADELL